MQTTTTTTHPELTQTSNTGGSAAGNPIPTSRQIASHPGSSSRTGRPGPPASGLARPRVLVCDPSIKTCNLIQVVLGEAYDCVRFGTGEEVLAEAFARGGDLVLTDVALPGLDGIELCRRL